MKWLPSRRSRSTTSAVLGDSPEAQAAYWLSRVELGLLRREEEEELERWRCGPQNEGALAELRAMLHQVQAAASKPEIGRMRSEALARGRRGPLLLGHVPVGVAVAVLSGCFGVLFLWQMATRPSVMPAQPVPLEVYETGKGERRTITLADGSSLTLNTESRAEAAMGAERRTVRLVRGQALFEVAEEEDRPFAVLAGSLEVTALGTQFDVRLDGGQAKVVLVEGRILVEPLARHGVARLLPILDRHYLKTGEQLVVRKGQGEMTVGVADIEQSTSWRYGRLVFRNDTLASAVAEFNRYNQRQLTIADEKLGQLPVSGVFSISRPENFLAAVSSFYPLRIQERSPQITVLTLQER